MTSAEINLIKIPKNCLTCIHLESDWCDCGGDFSCSHGSYLLCGKADDKSEVRTDKMYINGEEAPYLTRYKRCWEAPDRVSFNDVYFKIGKK